MIEVFIKLSDNLMSVTNLFDFYTVASVLVLFV